MKECFDNKDLSRLQVSYSVDYLTIFIPVLIWITILLEMCR